MASEQPEVERRAGAQLLEVDLDALDATTQREHPRLRLDARRDEDALWWE